MIGVILANTGSPDSPEPDAIEAYLREYLMDERIRQLPKPLWKWLTHRHILPKRKHSSAKRYRFIWTDEGSPLVVNARVLAEKVQRLFDDATEAKPSRGADAGLLDAGAHDAGALDAGMYVPVAREVHDSACGEGESVRGDDARHAGKREADGVRATISGERVVVRSAMSYGSPSIAEALEELRREGAAAVVLLPLYPQSAYSPTMAVVDSFWRAQDAIGWHPRSLVIDNYHDDEGYINAIADSVRAAGYDPAAGDRLLFSLHAIPLKDEAAGDTYRSQIAESVRLVAERLGIAPGDITVSFQSVFGHDPSKWTTPLSLDVLEGWRDGDFRVVYACPGFSIDCLETLYDIPCEMVPALEGEGAAPVVEHVGRDIQAACNTSGRFVWVPTLNTSDEHAALVKGVLDKSMANFNWEDNG